MDDHDDRMWVEQMGPRRTLDRSPQERHRLGGPLLADEHTVLLREVRRRAQAVRSALGAGRWPDRELSALVAYLRYEVLDQAVTEESLLFPLVGDGRGGGTHRLAIDHARIRDVTDQLACAATADAAHHDPGSLVEVLEDLDRLLDEHMHTEQAVLSAATGAGVESLRRPFRCHLWFPLTEGSALDLDLLPRAFAHRAALERFSRMRPGETVVVRSRRELASLWEALSSRRPGAFGWVYLDEGPARWRAEVTRRSPR
jgi:uncharacterized protein (DUF2249 family)